MKKQGFTIVELIIVITIMGILIILSVMNAFSTQANARDMERKTDAETIAMHLETYYTSGSDASASAPGEYPGTTLISSNKVHTLLRDIDDDSVTAPGNNTTSPDPDILGDPNTPSITFIPAADGTILNSSSAHPTIDEYVYQPLQANGSSLCTDDTTQECVKFNLYYRQEVANISANCPSPGTVCMIKSKNQ